MCREHLLNSAHVPLFVRDNFLREVCGKNYRIHWCSWSQGFNRYSSSPSSTMHCKFPSPSATTSPGLSGLPGNTTQTFISEESESIDNHTILSPGSLHLTIHSYNEAKEFQEVPKWIRGLIYSICHKVADRFHQGIMSSNHQDSELY